MNKHFAHKIRAFSILEVIITISVLLVMVLAVSDNMKNSIDVQLGVAVENQITHRLSLGIKQIVNDLEHAYILDTKNQSLNPAIRATKALFRITKGSSDELFITTFSKRGRLANSFESDQTFVVYKVDNDSETGLTNLYRGESRIIPDNFRTLPPLRLVTPNVKSLKITPWRGDQFTKNSGWDTDKSEWRNTLPGMVEVELEIYTEENGEEACAEIRVCTAKINTIVYIARSQNAKPSRKPSSTIRWTKL